MQLATSLDAISACVTHFPTIVFKQVVALKQNKQDMATVLLEKVVEIP